MDRYAAKMVWILAKSTIHRWLGSAGLPRRYHFPVLLVGSIVMDGVTAYIGLNLRGSLEPLGRLVAGSPAETRLLKLFFLIVVGAAMLAVVVAESSTEEARWIGASIRVLPVSARF